MMDIRKILNLKMTKLKYQIKPKTQKFKVLLTPYASRFTHMNQTDQFNVMSNVET